MESPVDADDRPCRRESETRDWVCVKASELAHDEIVRVADRPPIALARVGAELVAFLDVCPHLGATLSEEAQLSRGRVVCRAHGRAYRLLREGERLRGAERPVAQFPVTVLRDCVHVSLRRAPDAPSRVPRLTRWRMAPKGPA